MQRTKYASYKPLSPREEAERIIRRHFPTEDGQHCACCLTFAGIEVAPYECEPVRYGRRLLEQLDQFEPQKPSEPL